MKFLKIYDRNKNLLENISDFNYSSLSKTGVSKIEVAGNRKDLLEKIVEVYDHNEAKISGVVKGYSLNKDENAGMISIFPLIVDLKEEFITDSNLTPPGDKYFYVSDSIENVLDEIMTQYLAKVSDPILTKGTFATTGKSFTYTFENSNLFEAMEVLRKKMLAKGFYIDVSITGEVNLVNIPGVVDLKYLKDVKSVSFEERVDENIKRILFDNKREATDPLRIFKEYTNTAVTRGRAMMLSDSRFTNEASVDEYVANIFAKEGSGIVEVQNIISEVDVDIYSKVNLYNWEQNFGDIYVVEKEYLEDGTYNLKLGNENGYDTSNNDRIQAIDNSISNLYNALGSGIPEYIHETYIDSVSVLSPLIGGNDGLFSGIVKVGSDGIVIDGPNKKLYSQNYSLLNKTGFGFSADGTFLLGQDSNNYFQYDGTNFLFSGKIIAAAGSSIEWADVDNTPSNIVNPDYIKSTYIDQTSIVSPSISGNNGYFSGTFKVGSSGIIIDGVNENIRSSNYIAGSSGWIIKDNGDAEFQNGTFRGQIKATSGDLTGAFRILSPGYIEIYQSSSNRLLMGLLSGRPALQFLDDGVLVSELIGENNKAITLAGQSLSLDCLSVSDDLYVGRDLAVQDDLVVNDDFYLGGQVVSELSFGGSADIVFNSTSNRLYGDSAKSAYIYYNGTNWIIKDAAGVRTL